MWKACSAKAQAEMRNMPEWLEIVLLFAGYLALMRWVLPRFGVPT
jgi:hypothetical protein